MNGYNEFARVYDILTDNVGYDERSTYYLDILKKFGITHGILLDLACGTGSFSVRFAKKGFEVIGIDISPEMLSIAQQNAYESGSNILFLCQDMRNIDLFGTVDAAVCALDSINHLTDINDVLDTFKAVSLFMNPGGVFVFDTNTVYKHRHILSDNTFVYDCDDVYCVWQNTTDTKTDTVHISLDIFEENEDGTYDRSTEEFNERAYPTELIEELLNKAGFELLAVYDEHNFLPLTDTSQRAVFAAKKT